MDFELKGLEADEWFSEPGQYGFWVTGVEEANWAERRADRRNPAVVRVRIDPGGKMATTSDISLGGMLVNTHNILDQGQPVDLMIDSQVGVLQARGVVRWMSKALAQGEANGSYCMGVQFTWLSLEMGSLLR